MSLFRTLRPALPILIGASVMLSLALGLRQSLGIFMPPLTRDTGLSVSDFTLAIALQNLTWGLLQPLAGAWAARLGMRRLMVGGALLYIVAALSLGVFISTFAKTQFQAMQMAFFTFLPQILLSGFMFPYAGMPKPAQWIAEILPLTHFIRLIRGIMLRAAELGELRRELWILLGFTALMLALATLRFRKRLD